MSEITYYERMFAFLDILGFERMIDESRSNPELIGKIANMLKRSKRMALVSLNAKPTVLKVEPSQYTYRAFSDTILISGPYTSHDDMIFLSAWVMYYQYFMWKEEQSFLRGVIVYGDIYQNEEIIFGPALIDAFHLEKGETGAVWPRVLIDDSLLNKSTETEQRRDFYEFLRRDDDNLVYLDYLRDVFHMYVFSENKRVIGERRKDFGAPIELFQDHKAAILRQVGYALKQGNQDERNKILWKYFELSKYHNATINIYCQVIKDLLKSDSIIRDFIYDGFRLDLAKKLGGEYKPIYSAEVHPEQSDMLTILCAAMNIVIASHQEDVVTLREEAVNNICLEVPLELSKLEKALNEPRIDLDSFIVNS